MDIVGVGGSEKSKWNSFICANFPPVGAFLQSWEWGEFKKRLGTKSERFAVKEGDRLLAVAAFEKHAAPFGVSYIYAPRGPVIAKDILGDAKKISILFCSFESHFKARFPGFSFARLEPPLEEEPLVFFKAPFYLPRYYIQPRYNETVDLTPSEQDIIAGFSRDMRQDIRAAEKRGIRVLVLENLDKEHYEAFQRMQKDTSGRAGKNVYPSHGYFDALFSTLVPLSGAKADTPSIGAFFAFADGAPVACHIVVFFGATATYLYGASYSGKESSKSTSYLHWSAMREAKKHGFNWYDLGGIDPARWPTLTYFKRQFNGREFRYIGNADMVFKPAVYKIYNFLRRLRYPEK